MAKNVYNFDKKDFIIEVGQAMKHIMIKKKLQSD